MNRRSVICELQEMYFDLVDIDYASSQTLSDMIRIFTDYELIIFKLFQENPTVYDNFFYIGLDEITDHFSLFNLAADDNRLLFEDLKSCFLESILDVRHNLIRQVQPGSMNHQCL